MKRLGYSLLRFAVAVFVDLSRVLHVFSVISLKLTSRYCGVSVCFKEFFCKQEHQRQRWEATAIFILDDESFISDELFVKINTENKTNLTLDEVKNIKLTNNASV